MSSRVDRSVVRKSDGSWRVVLDGAGRVVDLYGTRSRDAVYQVARKARNGAAIDRANISRDFKGAVRKGLSRSAG